MQTILPHDSAIIVAENEQELQQVFDTITSRHFYNIKEISHFFSYGLLHVYIFERQNILIVKYAGDFNENAETMLSDFYVVHGFNY